MTELDFEAKYQPGRRYHNEVDELGEYMNVMSTTLEHTISELKSANNQLQIDIDKKTQIDEMRKEFLSNVSHELKTPLALIQGYAEGLKECINDDAESREFYCDVIMDEASKMNQMVKNLLTLNQLEFGSNRYSNSPYGGGYAPGSSNSCGTGNLCCDLWIADSLCECMGGDLCTCI